MLGKCSRLINRSNFCYARIASQDFLKSPKKLHLLLKVAPSKKGQSIFQAVLVDIQGVYRCHNGSGQGLVGIVGFLPVQILLALEDNIFCNF